MLYGNKLMKPNVEKLKKNYFSLPQFFKTYNCLLCNVNFEVEI